MAKEGQWARPRGTERKSRFSRTRMRKERQNSSSASGARRTAPVKRTPAGPSARRPPGCCRHERRGRAHSGPGNIHVDPQKKHQQPDQQGKQAVFPARKLPKREFRAQGQAETQGQAASAARKGQASVPALGETSIKPYMPASSIPEIPVTKAAKGSTRGMAMPRSPLPATAAPPLFPGMFPPRSAGERQRITRPRYPLIPSVFQPGPAADPPG